MFSYENGLFVALLIWLYSAVMAIVSINSQFERNLNKVGMRLSWLSFNPKYMDESDVARPFYKSLLKFLFLSGISFATAFSSWVYVFLFVGMFVYMKSKDSGAPREAREFRWRLRNLDMSFDEIVEGMLKMKGGNLENLDYEKNALREHMRDRGLL